MNNPDEISNITAKSTLNDIPKIHSIFIAPRENSATENFQIADKKKLLTTEILRVKIHDEHFSFCTTIRSNTKVATF